jgi:hypothetical protein
MLRNRPRLPPLLLPLPLLLLLPLPCLAPLVVIPEGDLLLPLPLAQVRSEGNQLPPANFVFSITLPLSPRPAR